MAGDVLVLPVDVGGLVRGVGEVAGDVLVLPVDVGGLVRGVGEVVGDVLVLPGDVPLQLGDLLGQRRGVAVAIGQAIGQLGGLAAQLPGVVVPQRLQQRQAVIAAEPGEGQPNQRLLAVVGLEDWTQSLGDLLANGKHPQAVAVDELEARVALPDLHPEPPDAEVPLPDVGVVQQDDPPAAELREPAVEVVTDGVVGVEPVDVQQVDRPVRELPQGLVEGGLQERRDSAVAGVVVRPQLGQDFRAVDAAVFVPLPGVDGEAAGLQIQRAHHLAEGAVGETGVSPQLHQGRRPRRADQVGREGEVLGPGTPACPVRGGEAGGVVEEVQHPRLRGCRDARPPGGRGGVGGEPDPRGGRGSPSGRRPAIVDGPNRAGVRRPRPDRRPHARRRGPRRSSGRRTCTPFGAGSGPGRPPSTARPGSPPSSRSG